MNQQTSPDAGEWAQDGLPLGAHLSVRRTGYLHHGVYVGHGEIIHFRRPLLKQPRGRVVQTVLEDFARGQFVCIETTWDAPFTGADVAQRARSRLGEPGYSLLWNNCEHFSTWCVRGVARSQQVERLLAMPGQSIARIKRQLLDRWASFGRRVSLPSSTVHR